MEGSVSMCVCCYRERAMHEREMEYRRENC